MFSTQNDRQGVKCLAVLLAAGLLAACASSLDERWERETEERAQEADREARESDARRERGESHHRRLEDRREEQERQDEL